MKNIRESIFETNSSSMHAICISKEDKIDIPKSMFFKRGEYGYFNYSQILKDKEDRWSYLYELVLNEDYSNSNTNCMERLMNFLNKLNIKYQFEGGEMYGEIDNRYGSDLFLEKVFNNDEMLKKFLFSNDCTIIIEMDHWDSVLFERLSSKEIIVRNVDKEKYDCFVA